MAKRARLAGQRRSGRATAFWLSLAGLLLVAAMAAGILWGSEAMSLRTAWEGLGKDASFLRLRIPRVLLAAIAGGGLAVVGGAFQALLRNPLAEPYILGVSGGAALGAISVIALGLSTTTALGLTIRPIAALLGGLATTALVYAVARRAPRGPAGATILLAGVMINAIASALITFIKTLVDPWRAQQLLRWLVGFIELPTRGELVAVALYVLIGCGWLIAEAGRLNLLALGDESAASLGVNVKALERRVFIAASCVVGAIVSLTGLIGFVGLVVPHALRRLLGPDHRLLLPMAFLIGATMLVLCDLGARLAFGWFDDRMPVGAVTALIGGPAFLVILVRGSAARS